MSTQRIKIWCCEPGDGDCSGLMNRSMAGAIFFVIDVSGGCVPPLARCG
ncbi:hypothetical protein SynTAK9802_01078 [Synechococcus sp. TAK9802]|nr:hypothetical protein SynTAK9802_01078 [Synechococcus sp. TAK9802]